MSNSTESNHLLSYDSTDQSRNLIAAHPGSIVLDQLLRSSMRTNGSYPTSDGRIGSAVEINPSDNDIICSKDKTSATHSGNQRFRDLIDRYAPIYDTTATKQGRMELTKKVVQQLSEEQSRFVKQLNCGTWIQMTDAQARDKVSHALRFSCKHKGACANRVNPSYRSDRPTKTKNKSKKSTKLCVIKVSKLSNLEQPVRVKDAPCWDLAHRLLGTTDESFSDVVACSGNVDNVASDVKNGKVYSQRVGNNEKGLTRPAGNKTSCLFSSQMFGPLSMQQHRVHGSLDFTHFQHALVENIHAPSPLGLMTDFERLNSNRWLGVFSGQRSNRQF